MGSARAIAEIAEIAAIVLQEVARQTASRRELTAPDPRLPNLRDRPSLNRGDKGKGKKRPIIAKNEQLGIKRPILGFVRSKLSIYLQPPDACMEPTLALGVFLHFWRY